MEYVALVTPVARLVAEHRFGLQLVVTVRDVFQRLAFPVCNKFNTMYASKNLH
jgi:hypothetical protein